LGPVTPLLAVMRRMREMRPEIEFSWIGTPQGPEASLVEAEGVAFHSLPVAKLARYPSKNWLTFPFDYLKALDAAKRILQHEKPSAVFSAGGFTQVPVIRAAAKIGIPCAVHQLDYAPLLSNKAVARQCRMLTSSFEYPSPQFGGVKAIRVSTPCRFANVPTPERAEAAEALGLDPDKATVFVTGGGTGALALNKAILEVMDELLGHAQILHLTGRGKMGEVVERPGFKTLEFLDETGMLNAYSASDVVVSRAGFGSLSEMAALSKPVIVVPLPRSPQEENARALTDAVSVVHQDLGFADTLKTQILKMLSDSQKRDKMGRNLHQRLQTDNGQELAEKWLGLLE